MSLLKSSKEILSPAVEDWESMYKLIREYRIIPFFENPIPGYSIQEHTPEESWFTSENLGPWDWKIECIRCGDIAYGKFLWGGKAAFATIEAFRELINWRRSLPKYAPTPDQQRILDHIAQYGTVLESWFPLGGRGNPQILFDDPTIAAIAEAHGRTSAQVILRWHLQAGNIAIPGSSNPDHILENISIFDFELTDEEMAQMTNLDRNDRFADY